MTPQLPTPDVAADLGKAEALHAAGRLADAGALYQRILAAKPKAIAAVHGLALIAIDLGEPARALPLLARCLALKPQDGLYRTSLGLALLRLGNAEQAAAHLLDAANLMPGVIEPRLYLARALGALGRWSQAAPLLADAAAQFPSRADVWAAKGNTERMLLRHADAEASLRRALALVPADADALNNLGVVLRAQGRIDEAIATYREALTLAPERALIHANLGNALAHVGRAPEAEEHLRKAVSLDPAAVEARTNLAAFLVREERPLEAIPLFRAVLAVDPSNVDALTNHGVALLDCGDPAGAEASYRLAIAASPKNGEAHYNLAWALLLTGQWIEGWHEYEWRWSLPNFSSKKRSFKQPMWDGGRLEGTLLLHAEQGLGDAIQFIRYAALAKTRCARVVVDAPAPLRRLFAAAPGVDAVVEGALPAFDAQIPFMSLARVFATTPSHVPASAGYLTAPDAPDSLKLPTTKRQRIGLVWAGSPDNKIDRRRTLPAKLFAPLVAATDADFVSLQVGPRAREALDLPADKIVFACDGRVRDFADTAAVIRQLDLVMGVDTAVMHLAGALGKPAWMILPFAPDYRWLLGRETTPWYDSLRLFRQGKDLDWRAVFAALENALTNWQPGAR